MIGDYFMAAKSIGLSKCNGRKPQSLETAAKHNKRELREHCEWAADVGGVDASRSERNYTIAGARDSDGVMVLAQGRARAVGFRPKRKDYTQAIEVVFSLPAESEIGRAEYFAACVAWCAGRFGDENILSADVHLDQAVPHCHALIAPIQAGEWVGHKLLQQDAYKAMRDDFQEAVAGKYGLRMPERLKGARKADAVAMVLQNIKNHDRALLSSPAWESIRRAIERDAGPFLTAYGLELKDAPAKPTKTMHEIFQGPGKGAKKERETLHLRRSNPKGIEPSPTRANPIGIEAKEALMETVTSNPKGIEGRFQTGGQKTQSLSCVGIELSGVCLEWLGLGLSRESGVEGRTVELDNVEEKSEPGDEPLVTDDDAVTRDREAFQFEGDNFPADPLAYLEGPGWRKTH